MPKQTNKPEVKNKGGAPEAQPQVAHEQEATVLTEKQELLCREYLIDLNQTKAYMRAFGTENYDSARTEASKHFANPNIRTRVKELMEERSKVLMVDSEYVLTSLIDVATRCQQGEPVMVWDYEEKCMKPTGEWQFDSAGANKALELIGKHLGMFNKIEVSGALNISQITGMEIK